MKQSTLFKQWGQKRKKTTANAKPHLTEGSDKNASTVVSSNGRTIKPRGSSISYASSSKVRSESNFSSNAQWFNERGRGGYRTYDKNKQLVVIGQKSPWKTKQPTRNRSELGTEKAGVIDLEDDQEELLQNGGKADVEVGFEVTQAEIGNDEIDDCDMMNAALELEKMDFDADQHADGFEMSAGETWIYPTNMSVRQYQFEIVEKALFHNTMVVLPTGLGKTFIAAVIMYNYHRWFPTGKAVFLAPTKPLVNQQISACTKIMGLPKDDIVELTGQMSQKKREQMWSEKQLLFLTPQTMSNDLNREAFDPKSIRLLMIDEAHKAKGNYAYCQVVAKISESHSQFRIVALTATPGSDVKAVQEVVTNLKISHVEVRTEQQLTEYCHNRSVQTHVVHLRGPILQIRTQFLQQVLMPLVGKLRQSGLMWTKNAENLSRFEILSAWGKFREKQGQQTGSYSAMSQTFYIGQFLYQAWEFLNNQGLRSMFCHLRDGIDGMKTPNIKPVLRNNPELMNVFARLKARFDGKMMDGLDASAMLASQSMNASRISTSDIFSSEDFYHSHPKLEKLEEIVLQHFKSSTDWQDTRVMIFSTYRESVHEITEMLMRHKPMIKVMSFVGQGNQSSSVTAIGGVTDQGSTAAVCGDDEMGAENCDEMFEQARSMKRTVGTAASGRGLKQAHQKKIIEKFKSGHFNVLVSTCVGEEGLDIGEVDLIVNFDTPKSLVRLIQRAGRTGRKRQGVIHAILTAGKEEISYKNSGSQTNKMDQVLDLVSCDKIKLHPVNPRVIPVERNPVVVKKFLVNCQEETKYEEMTDKKSKKSKEKDNSRKPVRNCKKVEPNDYCDKVTASKEDNSVNNSEYFDNKGSLPAEFNDVIDIDAKDYPNAPENSASVETFKFDINKKFNEPCSSGQNVSWSVTGSKSTNSKARARPVDTKKNGSSNEKRDAGVDEEFEIAVKFFPLSEKLMKEFNKMLAAKEECEERVDCLSVNIREKCIVNESPASACEVKTTSDEDANYDQHEKIDQDIDTLFGNSFGSNDVDGNDRDLMGPDTFENGDQNYQNGLSLRDKRSNSVEQVDDPSGLKKFENAWILDRDLSNGCFDEQRKFSTNNKFLTSFNKTLLETTLEDIQSNYDKIQIPFIEHTANRTFHMNFDYKFAKPENAPEERKVTTARNLMVSHNSSTMNEDKQKIGRLSEATCSYALSDQSCEYQPLMERINRKNQPPVVSISSPNQPSAVDQSSLSHLPSVSPLTESSVSCVTEQKQVAVVRPTVIDSSLTDKSNYSNKTDQNYSLKNGIGSFDLTKTPLRINQRIRNASRFNVSIDSTVQKKSRNTRPVANKRHRMMGRFLATQAQASDGEDDDEDHLSDWESDDLEFLASQTVHDKSEMQYVYMRSVNHRSPSLSPAEFLKKYLRKPASKLTKNDVMSQPVHEESSYLEDSFFVGDEDEIVYSESEESSEENSDGFDVSRVPRQESNGDRSVSGKSKRQRLCSNGSSFGRLSHLNSRKRKSGSPVEHRKRRRRVLAASMLDETNSD